MFGALSSAIIVVGIGLVYGITGTTNIGDSIIALANLDASLVPIGLLAVALFIAGLASRWALCHSICGYLMPMKDRPLPSAHCWQLAPRRLVCAADPVIVLGMFALNLDWTLTLAIVAVFTMTLGNLAALCNEVCQEYLRTRLSHRQVIS